MKKIFTLLLVIPIITFASLNVEKVISTLSNIKGKKQIEFFNANENIPLGNKLKLTSLGSADIILFSSDKHESKMTIVNSYRKLKLNPNSIGAIYVKKGRTQIVFVQERLDSYGLVLNNKFNKHIIHEWQLNPKSLIYNLK